MNGRERGFLLLTSHLGDPGRKPLTVPQLRQLAIRVREMDKPAQDRELEVRDLISLGYGQDFSERILALLGEKAVLDYYLHKGNSLGCTPLTRVSEGYPLLLRKRLGLDSPGCLWAKGDVSLLEKPAVALVGSRELREENYRFACEVGRQAALQGYVLVSGNARGADKAAQESCLDAGGQVISVVADNLWKHPAAEGILYLSEEDFDQDFSAQRALSRNRCIHGLGTKTFVAQAGLKTGGTWDGTVKNLRAGWSKVYCYDDGSDAALLLHDMGAELIGIEALEDFYGLSALEQSIFDYE